jgi:NCAIR mutase (PurE)-related protein
VNPDHLKRLLEAVAAGERSPGEALQDLAELPYSDLGFAKLDLHRELRNGLPEAVFGEGKELEDLKAIVDRLVRAHGRALVTRIRP